MPSTPFETLRFGEPQFLWLLIAPAVLLALWGCRLTSRLRERRAFRRRRLLPARERLTFGGGLFAWLCLLASTVFVLLALARPAATVPLLRPAGVDIVILQDGSASMRVRDVTGDRWQRSMLFLRTLGESLRWDDDRIALALFAHVAEPQIRLTRDPNVFFFFLDHLDEEPPFRLEDDTTWDTNIELGLFWGVRLIDKDREIHGRSPNARVFVLISDGQAWSGGVAQSIALARARNVPIFVVGVGTATGGPIPEPPRPRNIYGPPPEPPIHSRLDRESLMTIATAGEGEYFEVNRQSDGEISNRIISAARRRAGSIGTETTARDLYWECLVAAACLLAVRVVFMQGRVELWLATVGSGIALLVVWTVAG